MSEQVGVLVMAYGTASGPADIERYYTDIRGGRTPSAEHLQELTDRYAAIGNRFPLLDTTRAQADGLVSRLNADEGPTFRAYLGMKHSSPFIPEAVERMRADGITRAIGIVMAPHWSGMSIETYIERVQLAVDTAGGGLDVSFVRGFHDHPSFIDYLSGLVGETLSTLTNRELERPTVVFTAHSLPARQLEDDRLRCKTCDCDDACRYEGGLRRTGDLVAARLGLGDHRIAWQSVGRTADPWWRSITDVIPQLARQERTAVIVCCAGFVADHLETLYDLDIEAAGAASSAGSRSRERGCPTPTLRSWMCSPTSSAIISRRCRSEPSRAPGHRRRWRRQRADRRVPADPGRPFARGRGAGSGRAARREARRGHRRRVAPSLGRGFVRRPQAMGGRAVPRARSGARSPRVERRVAVDPGGARALRGRHGLRDPGRSGHRLAVGGAQRTGSAPRAPRPADQEEVRPSGRVARRVAPPPARRRSDRPGDRPAPGGLARRGRGPALGPGDLPRARGVGGLAGSSNRGAQAAMRLARRGPDLGPLFLRPRGGVHELTAALAARLRGRIRTATTVAGLAGVGGDAVVLAVPAAQASALLQPVAPDAAAELASIRAVSTSVALLVYPEGTAEGLPGGSGFVVPRGMAPFTAVTWLSSKWPDPAFGTRAVLRCFVGADGDEDVLDAPDDDIVGACARHLTALLPLPEPAHAAVIRWPASMPQYGMGHLDRVARARAQLAPGVVICGQPYDGVGVADCVRAANETAAAVLHHLESL